MTKRIPQPRSELSPGIRAHEARLLAVMLRTSRLTWVFGEPGTDTTALLTTSLMPLLQRRRSDRNGAPTVGSAEVPQRERRRQHSAGPVRPGREAALYFDAWADKPLSDLKTRIGDLLPEPVRPAFQADASWADMLALLQGRFGFKFVFLLDHFEELLAHPNEDGEATRFVDELADAVQHPALSTGFVIAMNEDARPRLERLRSRIPGFDDNVLRLTPIADARGPMFASPAAVELTPTMEPAPSAVPLAKPPMPATPKRGPPPRVPIRVEQVYAFIEKTLEKTSLRTRVPDVPVTDSGEVAPRGTEASPGTRLTQASGTSASPNMQTPLPRGFVSNRRRSESR